MKKKRESIKAEYAKYYNNLIVNEKRLAELDTGDKHYDRRVDSLNRVMDDLYEKIDDSQSRLDELDNEIAMAEKSTLTKQSIFEMLEGFSKYYDVMTPEDRKALLQAMISYIELYGEKRADGHFVKAIHFTFPVTYDGESGALFVRINEQQVETVSFYRNGSTARSSLPHPLSIWLKKQPTGKLMDYFWLQHPEVKRLSLCFDRDDPGRNFTKIVAKRLAERGYIVQDAPPAIGKDYNDYLLAARRLMQGGVRACSCCRLNR